MHFLRLGSVVAVSLIFTSCETPLEDSWNNLTSRQTDPAEDRDARYGLRSDGSRSDGTRSQTEIRERGLPPGRPVADNDGVRLKPFRSFASQPTPFTRPSSTPRPSVTPRPATKSKPSPSPFLGPRSGDADRAVLDPAPEPKPKSSSEDVSPSSSNEPPPFASPVPGRKGYVTSPYSPDAGFIDVTGLEPGTPAKDPYSGKVFRVP